MLGKLIRHDIKSIWKLLCIIYGAIIFTTIIGFVTVQTLHLDFIRQNYFLALFSKLFIFTYVILVISGGIVTMTYLIVHFYRNMYGDEGYLMHTLPVKSSSLITSKLINSVIWTVICTIVILFSTFTLSFANSKHAFSDISDAFSEFSTIYSKTASILNTNTFVLTLAIIFVLILSMCTAYLKFYFVISIGQLWSGHKLLGSVLTYIGLSIVTRIINSILTFTLMQGNFSIINNTDLEFTNSSSSVSSLWLSCYLPLVLLSLI